MGFVLDSQVDFQPKQPSFSTPSTRLRNLAYFCVPKTGITDEYVLVTDSADLATYTDDTRIEKAFTNGLNQVYLGFEGNITDFSELSNLVYTMIVSYDIDASSIDFSTFRNLNNVIAYTTDNPDALFPAGVPQTLAQTFATRVFYANGSESLAIEEISQMISLERNPNWDNNQYGQFPNNTSLVKSKNDIDTARGAQYSFVASDTTDTLVPELMYSRAGGFNAVDYYIVENLRIDIQIALKNYIANKKPRYINDAIAGLQTVGDNIILQYATSFKVSSATLTIPAVQAQTSIDYINGLLNNLELKIVIANAIWYVKGTVTYAIQDEEIA